MPEVINAGSERHAEQMCYMAQFLGCSKIEYVDVGGGENYLLTRADGRTLLLKVRANRSDGGFLVVDVPGMQPVMSRSLDSLPRF